LRENIFFCYDHDQFVIRGTTNLLILLEFINCIASLIEQFGWIEIIGLLMKLLNGVLKSMVVYLKMFTIPLLVIIFDRYFILILHFYDNNTSYIVITHNFALLENKLEYLRFLMMYELLYIKLVTKFTLYYFIIFT
jgi:hypothetical protein